MKDLLRIELEVGNSLGGNFIMFFLSGPLKKRRVKMRRDLCDGVAEGYPVLHWLWAVMDA